jgi:hypothetical protein
MLAVAFTPASSQGSHPKERVLVGCPDVAPELNHGRELAAVAAASAAVAHVTVYVVFTLVVYV